MSRHGSMNGAPPVAPKPGGKVLVYVYEAPGKTGTLQNGQLPPNAQLVYNRNTTGVPQYANGPEVQYPYSEECLDQDLRSRLKRRAKKSGKGYKVLADVTSSNGLRNSSKGGKMFMKQKKRMDEYTSSTSNEDAGEYRQNSALKINYARMENVPTSFNKVTQSPDVPSALYNTLTKGKKKRHAIPRLRSPPPEWRAKVDTNYPLYNESQNQSTNQWGKTDATFSSRPSRSKSTPPGNFYQQYNGMQEEENRYPPGLTNEARPGSSSGIVMVHFDARNRKGNPQWHQESDGRNWLPTKAHVEHDFNARATGWSKSYVQQY